MIKTETVIETAEALSREFGLANLSLGVLCSALNIPDGTFQHHTGMAFRDVIARLAGTVPLEADATVVSRRLSPQLRKQHILNAATELSEKQGYKSLTREQIASYIGVTGPLVTRYFGSMAQLRDAVVRQAIKTENLAIIAYGLSVWDKRMLDAPEAVKKRAAQHLLNGGDK